MKRKLVLLLVFSIIIVAVQIALWVYVSPAASYGTVAGLILLGFTIPNSKKQGYSVKQRRG